MAIVTKKEIVLVNMQKLQDEFSLEFGVELLNNGVSYNPKKWDRTLNAYEKYGVLIEVDNEFKHLIIIEGLEDNGVNNAKTLLSHWYYDGYVWVKKPQQRLSKENINIQRFIEGQNFDIWTSSWKYLKLVDGKPVYLDSEKDKDLIWVFGNEIFDTSKEIFDTNNEILNEEGNSFEPKQYASFEPKQYESYEPKQYEKLGLKPNVFDAYEFNESFIRPSQLSEIINRFPSVDEPLTI